MTAAEDGGWSDCPGCGARLPTSTYPLDRRWNASPACWELHTQVQAYELEHPWLLSRCLQLRVDTYAAQHSGDQTSALSLAFALIRLFLALERGASGLDVRTAHQKLARRNITWPRLERPLSVGSLTVQALADVASPQAYADQVQSWAADVWDAWGARHDEVAELVRQHLGKFS